MSNPAGEHSWNNPTETNPEFSRMDGIDGRFFSFSQAKEDDLLTGYSLQNKLRAQFGLPLEQKEPDSAEIVFANVFSAQWTTRARAVRRVAALWKELPGRVRRVLIHALRDESAYVRAIAAESLALFPDALPVRELLAISEDRSWQVRAAVVLTLGESRQQTLAGFFYRALKDQEPMVRVAALHALNKQTTNQQLVGDRRLLEAMKNTLEDKDARVRLAAIKVLQNHLPDPFIYQNLLKRLDDPDTTIVYETLNCLTQRGYHVGIDFLVGRVTNDREDPRLRLKALQLLRGYQEYLSLEPFLLLLKDPNPMIRDGASKFLAEQDGQIPQRVSSAYLLQLLQDEQEDFRAFAAWALGEQHARHAQHALTKAKKDQSPLVSVAADQALAMLQQRDTENVPLVSSPNSSWLARRQERKTDELELKQSDRRVNFLTSLVRYLQDKQGTVQPRIEETPDGPVLILFCRFQSDDERWREVVKSLAKSTQVESVKGALQSPDEIIREVTAQIIKRLEGKHWSELLITSVELLQDTEAQTNLTIPMQIVFCGIGLPPTDNEPTGQAPVLQEILSTFHQEGIDEYSQQIGTHRVPTLPLSERYSVTPNPVVLGQVLKSIQAWSGSPQTLVEYEI
ncbi:MAG TPA: HEAT repeat domain-containing protein [Ktedonobacteraceae bacterium]|nr:HEAT repeat domain-containing protein [Ktedonobacteraceae bacterium]